MLPDIVTPKSASQKNSNAPNDSATSASAGVNIARQITPNSVLTKAPGRRDADRAAGLAALRSA
jgi:hypothetical protein